MFIHCAAAFAFKICPDGFLERTPKLFLEESVPWLVQNSFSALVDERESPFPIDCKESIVNVIQVRDQTA
jgi:hypothetical protein